MSSNYRQVFLCCAMLGIGLSLGILWSGSGSHSNYHADRNPNQVNSRSTYPAGLGSQNGEPSARGLGSGGLAVNPFSTADSTELLTASDQDLRAVDNAVKEKFSAAERNNAFALDTRGKVVDLIEQIQNTTSFNSDAITLDELAETESLLLSQLQAEPELTVPLVNAYAELPENSAKALLRSMLSASGNENVERMALTNLGQNVDGDDVQWLKLLASTGVTGQQARNDLLGLVNTMVDSDSIATALHAFVPEVVSYDEKKAMVGKLETFTYHEDEQVRSAGIEALSRWANKQDSHFIERALTDESAQVKRAAIFSAYTSGISSQAIKQELLEILINEELPLTIRMDSHNALSAYSLQGDEHKIYYQFHLDMKAEHQQDGVPKG